MFTYSIKQMVKCSKYKTLLSTGWVHERVRDCFNKLTTFYTIDLKSIQYTCLINHQNYHVKKYNHSLEMQIKSSSIVMTKQHIDAIVFITSY